MKGLLLCLYKKGAQAFLPHQLYVHPWAMNFTHLLNESLYLKITHRASPHDQLPCSAKEWLKKHCWREKETFKWDSPARDDHRFSSVMYALHTTWMFLFQILLVSRQYLDSQWQWSTGICWSKIHLLQCSISFPAGPSVLCDTETKQAHHLFQPILNIFSSHSLP